MRQRPTLNYNFDTSAPLKGERHSHRMRAAFSRPLPKAVIIGTIRCKDEQLLKYQGVT